MAGSVTQSSYPEVCPDMQMKRAYLLVGSQLKYVDHPFLSRFSLSGLLALVSLSRVQGYQNKRKIRLEVI